MATIAAEKHVALYTVEVDGETLEEKMSKRIREVRLLNYLRLPDVVHAGRDLSAGDAATARRASVRDRRPARDQARGARGTDHHDALQGRHRLARVDFGPGSIELLVRGLDRSHVLQRSRRTRTFQNQTASDIVEKILREAGFDARTDSSGDPYEFVQQDNETDWDFIWRLAERIGFEFVLEDGTAHFRRQDADQPGVELEWPTTLHSFSPRVTAIQQVAAGHAGRPGSEGQADDRCERVDPGPDHPDRHRP